MFVSDYVRWRDFCPSPPAKSPQLCSIVDLAPLCCRCYRSSCCSWLQLRYYQYEISYAPYMLEPWEKVLVLAFLLSLAALTLWGVRNVAQRAMPTH